MKYISQSKLSFRIHIPLPNGETMHKRVSYKKNSKEQAKQKALQFRDELGYEHWGQFWEEILDDSTLLQRLPKTFEPLLLQERDKYGNQRIIYRSMWVERDSKGEKTRKCFKRSTVAHGFDGAYLLCKNALLKAYEDYIPLILFMKANGCHRYSDVSI